MAGKTITVKVSEGTYTKIIEDQAYNPEKFKTLSSVLRIVYEESKQNPVETNNEELEKLQKTNEELTLQVEELTNREPETVEVPAENTELLQKLEQTREALKLQKQINEQLANREPEPKEIVKTEPKNLTENQIVVDVKPSLMPILTEVAIRETNRIGHTVTKPMILINLFWKQISIGAGDHLPISYSTREVKNILNNVKKLSNGNE